MPDADSSTLTDWHREMSAPLLAAYAASPGSEATPWSARARPAGASRSAIARPMPRDGPVTSALGGPSAPPSRLISWATSRLARSLTGPARSRGRPLDPGHGPAGDRGPVGFGRP